MKPAVNKDIPISNSFSLNNTNGTSGLFNINPDQIHLEYNAHSDTTTSRHFIAKNSQLSMSYKMEIPLQFGGDLRISIDTTLENPFADKLDALEDQENLGVALLLNVQKSDSVDYAN